MDDETIHLGGGAGVGVFLFVNNTIFQGNIVDTCTLMYNSDEGYSVKGAYQLLTQDDQQSKEPITNSIWNKVILLKVSLFMLRLLNKSISTKDNSVCCCSFYYISLLSSDGYGN